MGQTKEARFQVYVGTYGKYNAGSIAGKWLDLEEYNNKYDFLTACRELHKGEHDPEFMFQDWEGIPDKYISESHIDDEFWTEYLPAVNEHGEELVAAAVACDVQIEDIGEAYAGQHNSDEDFTENLLEETGDLPKDLPGYIHIDWTWTAREIMMDYAEDNGYYFRQL